MLQNVVCAVVLVFYFHSYVVKTDSLVSSSDDLDLHMQEVFGCYTRHVSHGSSKGAGRCLEDMQTLVTAIEVGPMVWMEKLAKKEFALAKALEADPMGWMMKVAETESYTISEIFHYFGISLISVEIFKGFLVVFAGVQIFLFFFAYLDQFI